MLIWGEKQANPLGVAVRFANCLVASNSLRTARASSPIAAPTLFSKGASKEAASVMPCAKTVMLGAEQYPCKHSEVLPH